MCILLGLFERTSAERVYYNSTVVLGSDGNIVEGILPNGNKPIRYVKSHIPYHVTERSKYYDETVPLPHSFSLK